MVSHNRFSRAWYYFRQGWSVYFAFIFAAINTLTVTYYLAIEKFVPKRKFSDKSDIEYLKRMYDSKK